MRSDNAKSGMQQAPARSLFRALGLTDEEMERPLVGIVRKNLLTNKTPKRMINP